MSGELSREELDLLTTSGTTLLGQAGVDGSLRFDRLSGGRNNRVYRVTGRDKTVALKWYFRHAEDQRDRLSSEYVFYEYAIESGVSCVAEPLCKDGHSHFAVYSWLEGQRVAPDDVTSDHVEQAVEFIRALNDHRKRSFPEFLPVASEACFSIREHIDCVSARVGRLDTIPPDSANHRDAQEFAQCVIAPALAPAVTRLQKWARAANVDLSAPLATNQRCVSPSDFGFHNALIAEDGCLKFFDFEYAGWDDPAKLLCDFYCQPEVPAPRETWQALADLTAELAGDTELERQRQGLLFPLYQVKWCCILLNEFVATSSDRRKFSGQQPTDLTSQLEKAKRLADQLRKARG